jgi:hypothetical protein
LTAIVNLPVLVEKEAGLPGRCDTRYELLKPLTVQGFAKGGGWIPISSLFILEGHNNPSGT